MGLILSWIKKPTPLSDTGERVIIRDPSVGHTNTEREHLERYHFAARVLNGSLVLDLACGSGYGSRILKESGLTEVVGLDKDEGAVAFARAYHSSDGVLFEVKGVEELPFPDKYVPAVVSFETLEHLHDPISFVQEVVRVLQEVGTLIISTPNKEMYRLYTRGHKNPFHLKELSREEFEALLEGNFESVEYYSQSSINPLEWDRKSRGYWLRKVVKRVDIFGIARKTYNRAVSVGVVGKALDPFSGVDPRVVKGKVKNSVIMIAVCKNPKHPSDPNG